MLAEYEWRLDVRLREGGAGAWVPLRIRRAIRQLVIQLSGAVSTGVIIARHERDPAALMVFGRDRQQLEAAEQQLEDLLARRGLMASIAIDRWSRRENQWNQVRGSPDREERMGRHGLDDAETTFPERALGLTLAVLFAAGGVAVYAAWPYTFPAYQASTLGTMPLLIIVLIWLHRRLPRWFQWTAAITLLPLGPIGYLVVGGAQWWNWGQLSALPFLLLVFGRVSDREATWLDTSLLEPPVGPFGPP